jgi:hypothetical protein
MIFRLSPFLLIAFLLSFSSGVFAHTVKSDNEVGAVMHINPSDEPKAGQESVLNFEFKDKDGVFSLDNCSCDLLINLNGEELFSTKLTAVSETSDLSASITYVFPKPGNYNIQISGEPVDDKSYKNFNLSFEAPVTGAATPSPTAVPREEPESSVSKWFAEHVIHLAGAVLLAGFLVFALIKQARDGKRKQ